MLYGRTAAETLRHLALPCAKRRAAHTFFMSNKPLELSERAALITGASSGIGRATALSFAREGALVGLLGRNQTGLQEVQAEVEKLGGKGFILTADISLADEVAAAVEQFVSAAGRLDVVFANAGINGVWAPLHEIQPEEWRRTIDVNLNGTFYTLKYAVPHLKRGSSVVVCSSVNGTRIFSNPGATAYACSKGAQAVMVKMLAVELGRRGIRVNAVCPGFTDTEIQEKTETRDLEELDQFVEFPEGVIPLTGKVPASPDQIAEVVLFLASDRSDHVNGTEIWVDGGESLVMG